PPRAPPPSPPPFPYATLFRSLVPADHPFAVAGEHLEGELGELPLDLGDPGQAPFDHAGAGLRRPLPFRLRALVAGPHPHGRMGPDRKSTRLNSSHVSISYAVF